MLRLYILRHAKSSWAVPGAKDFDRELNDRGLADLDKIAAALSRKDYIPAQVLCSPAVRTRQTYDSILSAFGENLPEVSYLENLYSSGVSEYLELLNGIESPSSVMIVGHNPMCGNLAASLAGSGDQSARETIAYKYPTGTVTVLDFDFDSWSQVTPGSGKLLECIFPKEL